MKNKLWLIALITVIGFLSLPLTGCDDGGGTTTVPVTGVSLNKSSISLNVGDTETLTATVTPNNATNKAVTWSTSDAAVATVSNGVVTAVSAGSATITVKTADGNKTAECSVDVNNPSLSTLSGTVTISPSTAAVNTELTATYSGSETVSYQWKKDGNNVGTATTTKPNKYTPTQAGNYSVTVSLEGYNSKTSAPVAVTSDGGTSTPVTGVTLNKTSLSLAVGGSETLTATVAPSNATNKAVTWTSSDTTKATVANGVVTAVAAGSATITVKTEDGNKTAECSVDVNNPSLSTLSGTVTISPSTAAVNTELTATYSGSETVSYQWKKDGNNVGTATTAKPNKYTPTEEGDYSVTVSLEGYNPKTSAPVAVISDGGTNDLPSFIPPGTTVTKLTENVWADGNLPTSSDVQWFKFTATASTQYIHVNFDTLTDLYVQVYNSNGSTVGSETNLHGSTKYVSRTVTIGQEYYIKVHPYSSSYRGTYQIGFTTTTFLQPATTLTENVWADGNLLSSSDEQWFKFTATASTQYIHVSFGTLTNLYVQVYNSSGATVGSETSLSSSKKYVSQTVTSGQEYFIKVHPYSSSYRGTYRIGFNATAYSPGTTITPLTADTWADCNIPTSSDEQWFKFTATASTQYIHVSFGTLTNLYVQVYNSSGATVGSETSLSSSKKYVSQTVTSGQEYFIKVHPYSSSYRGTYRIGFTTTTFQPATTLTENVWADGNLPSSSDEQWFKFTATASTQYIHVSFDTSNGMNVQVYDSTSATVGSETSINYLDYNKYVFLNVTVGQEYYISVRPKANTSRVTYRIMFNTTIYQDTTTLTENVWSDNNLLLRPIEQWFKFTATSNTQYIHASFGTMRTLSVQLYNSSGVVVGSKTDLSQNNSGIKYVSLSVNSGQVYYIKVVPDSTSYGTYRIGFTTSVTAPSKITPPADATQLTVNTWRAGFLPESGEQCFKFTATASTQYIHASFDTVIRNLNVQLYDSSGTAVGNNDYFNDNKKYISRSVTVGQVYYIRIIVSSGDGVFEIAFNTSQTPPN